MAKMMTGHKYATPFNMLHAAMLLGQKSRLAKFSQAIHQIVKINDYVVDIGTGSGVLAIMAAQAGAGKVTAIDINRESIEFAKHAAALNNVADRIDFITGHFSDFAPTEKADVVICEMLSSIMLIEQQVPASYHAVEKILKPEGIIIPQRVTIYIVPVESSVMADRFTFNHLEFPKVVQTVDQNSVTDLADMQVLHEVDLTKPTTNFEIDRTMEFHIVSDGVIHGLVGLFESVLYNDINLNMEDGWKQLFLPIESFIEVSKGEKFSVKVTYTPGKYNSLQIAIL
ncbi:MAG: 50S ribosomal protein L11 methyltransferase [Candidatus Thorarchaeota archaeon]